MKKFGLIGKNLNYSYSKIIHNFLIKEYNIAATYELIEVDNISEELLGKYDGLNITIPFKMQVCDFVDTSEKSCNLVFRQKGYNVDIDGFKYLLTKFDFHINKIVVLGNGGSATMIKSLEDYEVTTIETTNAFDLHLDNIFGDILVNATPIGMNEYKSLVNENIIKNFKGVIDLNYNPINSKLKLQCINANVSFTNGLDMLIIQAIKSFEIFNELTVSKNVFDKLLLHIYKELQLNIAIIGMSLAGKTTLVKKFNGIDLDEIITKDYGEISNLIVDENNFRKIEHEALKNNLDKKLISLGGGIVKLNENFELLQNHLIIFLNTPIEVLSQRLIKNSRPLLKNQSVLEKLYYERIGKYYSFSNLVMDEHQLEGYLYEYFSN